MSLSVADMAAMRETLVESLPDPCAVIVDTLVDDDAGGHRIGSTTTTYVPCRISPRLATGTGQLKDAETEQAGRIITQAPWLVTLPANIEVSAKDQIGAWDGRVFEVFAVLGRRSNELATLVTCRLINEGVG
ncbi:MAG: hypothetical protein H0W41_06695 [Chloroflexi bacterium]|nr:hypothetical protein [Chloroflexota bacterium]